MKPLSGTARIVVLLVISVLIVGFAAGSSEASVGEVLSKMLLGPFQSPGTASKSLEKFTPLLVAGVAVFWALRAGLFNIGVEGQFAVGGLAASAIALRVGGSAGVVAGLLAGTAAGCLWALLPAWLRAFRGAHEVISTIMMNNIAGIVCAWLIAGPLMAPNSTFPATASVGSDSRVPNVFQNGPFAINLALILALGITLAYWVWYSRSVSGFELAAVGQNATAARFAGVQSKQVMFRAMLGSGAVAGLAGGLQLLAYSWRFDAGFSAGYGYDALGVALLAGLSVWALIPGAVLFAVLNVGSTQVQFLGVPKGLTTVILAVLLIAFAATRQWRKEARVG